MLKDEEHEKNQKELVTTSTTVSDKLEGHGSILNKSEVNKVSYVGTRPLGRPRHRWEDGIRMDLREVG
jgi:hypothetical protein